MLKVSVSKNAATKHSVLLFLAWLLNTHTHGAVGDPSNQPINVCIFSLSTIPSWPFGIIIASFKNRGKLELLDFVVSRGI